MNTVKINGYQAVISFDSDIQMFRGEFVGLNGGAEFYAKDVDGLRREGNNLFAATEDSGAMDMGVAGTENYGKVIAYNIENSNVDLSQEMVNMIVNQRGFQSNSKVVTTADQMLQKAMELKRS